jgi:3-phytase
MKIYYLLALIFLLNSCRTNVKDQVGRISSVDSLRMEEIMEAREDSIEVAEALELQKVFTNRIEADTETEPVEATETQDAADDPAIWFNADHPAKSLILGTNKIAGLYVYNIEGKVLQYRSVGKINNVDLRDGYPYKGKDVVLVAGSNRSNNSISLLYIDKKTGYLSDTIKNIPSGVDEVYGICLYKNLANNKFYIFVNGKGGLLEQWILLPGNDSIGASKLRTINLPNQPEGMVAHDRKRMLYLGVEDEGIYVLPAEPAIPGELKKIPGSDTTNTAIVYDIEGLAIFSFRQKDYLLASIQGNYSYALFRLGKEDQYLTSFVITDGRTDGAEETDGLDIAGGYFSDRFPQGLLVVQDGYNYESKVLKSQNFKFVSMDKIYRLIDK